MVAENRGRRTGSNHPKRPREKAEKSYELIQPTNWKPPAVDPELLPPDLLYQREKLYAWATSANFERWLAFHVAEKRIPLDNCLNAVSLLVAFVEASLLARVEFPGLFAPDFDEPEEWAPETEAEAVAVGLSIRRPRKAKPPAPDLPGCRGDDGRCARLRRYGERFCSSCKRKELNRMRAAQQQGG